jgi:AraC-like DNA-binding protein
VLALALWRRPANAAANRVLAAWIAVVCVDLAVKALYLGGPSPTMFRAYRFVWLFPFLYGSLFYLYVRTLVTADAPRPRDAMHLAGFATMAALTVPIWLASPTSVAAAFARYQGGDWPPPVPWYDALLFVYSLSYVGAAVLRLYRYRRALRAQRSDAHRWSLRWVEVLALTQLAIWAIAIAHVSLHLPGIDYFLIYGAVAAWICVVGYFSLVQPPVVAAEAETPAASPRATAADATDDDPRAPAVMERLQQLMRDEAMYRAPALTIGQLARRSGYPEYLVSSVINRRFGATFWDWINQLRVDAVRACLDEPADTRTLLDIAYACGFTAKSTFNSAFKRRVGRTPSEYRRTALAASAQCQG